MTAAAEHLGTATTYILNRQHAVLLCPVQNAATCLRQG